MEALEHLRRANTPYLRALAARQLRHAVASLSRELPPEVFSKLTNDISRRIAELINNNSNSDRMAGIHAIYELVQTQIRELDVESKVIRYANYLRNVFNFANVDPSVLKLASKALGQLARISASTAPNFIEFESRRAIERLEAPERVESHVLSAVLVLRELADNAHTQFYKWVEPFFSSIWTALTDAKVLVRQSAAKALGSCLTLVAERQSERTTEYCDGVYNHAMNILGSKSSGESIHGALLGLCELLSHTRDYVAPHVRDICSTTLKYKDSRDRLIRCTVIEMLPKLAAFAPETFVDGYADVTLEHLLSSLRNPVERSPGYLAIGSVALALQGVYPASSLRPQLDRIVALVKEGLTPKRHRPFCTEALRCIAMLARAVGPALITHMHDLLDPMFAAGLTSDLAFALKQIVLYIPALLELVQERLLHEISLVLCGRPFAHALPDLLAFYPTNAHSALSGWTSRQNALRLPSSSGQTYSESSIDNVDTDSRQDTRRLSSKIGKLTGQSADAMNVAAAAVASASAREGLDTGLAHKVSYMSSGLLKSHHAHMHGVHDNASRGAGPPASWTKSMLAGTATAGGGAAVTNPKIIAASLNESAQFLHGGVGPMPVHSLSFDNTSNSKMTSQKKSPDSFMFLTRVQRTTLALRSLATFDFRGIQLLPFVRDIVLLYTEDADPVVRREAIITAAALLVSPNGRKLESQLVSRRKGDFEDQSAFGEAISGMQPGLRPLNRDLRMLSTPEAWYLYLDRELEPVRSEPLAGEEDDSIRWKVSDVEHTVSFQSMPSSEAVQAGATSHAGVADANDMTKYLGGVLPVLLVEAGPTLELVNEILQRIIMSAVADPHPFIRIISLRCLGAGNSIDDATSGYEGSLNRGGTLEHASTAATSIYTVGTNWAIEYQPKHQRITAFGSHNGGWFDALLAQPHTLRTLRMVLHDEQAAVREAGVNLLGRLTHRNPACIMPSLRNLLVELLSELELGAPARSAHMLTRYGSNRGSAPTYSSGGAHITQAGIVRAPYGGLKGQEQSIRLLGLVIKSAHRLVEPYVRPILQTLLPKLAVEALTGRNTAGPLSEYFESLEENAVSENSSDGLIVDNASALLSTDLVTTSLAALGELSEIGAGSMAPYVPQLVRLILFALNDRSDPNKQAIGVRTLGLLAGNTASVILPYLEHPALMPVLLGMLRSVSGTSGSTATVAAAASGQSYVPWSLRREVLRTIGIIGALDPHRFHLAQLALVHRRHQADMLARVARSGEYLLGTHERQAAAHAVVQAATTAARQKAAGTLGVGGGDPTIAAGVTTLGFGADEDNIADNDSGGGWWWRWAWATDDDLLEGNAAGEIPGNVPSLEGIGAIDPIMAALDGLANEDTIAAISANLAREARRRGAASSSRRNARSAGSALLKSSDSAMGNATATRTAASILPSNIPEREDYYPTVALTALLRILSDPSLTTHHSSVLQSVTWICRSLGQRCVSFLPHVVPAFLSILRQRVRAIRENGGNAALLGLVSARDARSLGTNTAVGGGQGASLREALLQQIGVLVLLVREHMRVFLPSLFALLHELWPSSLPATLRLIEHVAIALPNDFHNYIPGIMIHMLATLHNPTDPLASTAEALAHSARSFGTGAYDAITDSALSRYSYASSKSKLYDSSYPSSNSKQSEALGARYGVSAVSGTGLSASNLRDVRSLTLSSAAIETAVLNARHVLSTIGALGSLLEGQLDLLVPAILSFTELEEVHYSARRHALVTLSKLARNGVDLTDHSSRIVHTMARIIAGDMAPMFSGGPDALAAAMSEASNSKERTSVHGGISRAPNGSSGATGVGGTGSSDGSSAREDISEEMKMKRSACDTCCWLCCQLQTDFLTFVPLLRRAMTAGNFSHVVLDRLMDILLFGAALPPDPVDLAFACRELGWRDCAPIHGMQDLAVIQNLLGKDVVLLEDGRVVDRVGRIALLRGSFDGLGGEFNEDAEAEFDHTQIGDLQYSRDNSARLAQAMSMFAGAAGDKPEGDGPGAVKLEVNYELLARAASTEGRVDAEDWLEWMRRLTVELLRVSPAPALRACWNLAQVYRPLARELFNAAFVSCWGELNSTYQMQLVFAIEKAMHSKTVPRGVLHTLLNLAEFMEHDEKALPIETRVLGQLAESCHAYAKALRYKENEFKGQLAGEGSVPDTGNLSSITNTVYNGQQQNTEHSMLSRQRSDDKDSTVSVIESLISINNQLEQPEAAIGVLKYAQAQAALGDRDTLGMLGLGITSPKLAHQSPPNTGTHTAYRTEPSTSPSSNRSGNVAMGLGLLEIREAWYEKLGRWEDALEAYERRATEQIHESTLNLDVHEHSHNDKLMVIADQTLQIPLSSHNAFSRSGDNGTNYPGAHVPLSLQLGRMRCLRALGEWSKLHNIAADIWPQLRAEPKSRAVIAPLAAQAAWALGRWQDMERFLRFTSSKSMQGAFFRAVLSIHARDFDAAQKFIDSSRKIVADQLSSVGIETYTRSYKRTVTIQQLTEMEEIVHYMKLRCAGEHEAAQTFMQHLRPLWRQRLRGCQRNTDVWHRLLTVRTLVTQTEEDLDSWLKFASLCRRDSRLKMSLKVLLGAGMDGGGGFAAGEVDTGTLATLPPSSYMTDHVYEDAQQNGQSHEWLENSAVPMRMAIPKMTGSNFYGEETYYRMASNDGIDTTGLPYPAVVNVGVTGAGYFDDPDREIAAAANQDTRRAPVPSQPALVSTPSWAMPATYNTYVHSMCQAPQAPMPHAYFAYAYGTDSPDCELSGHHNDTQHDASQFDSQARSSANCGAPSSVPNHARILGAFGVGSSGNVRPHPKVEYAFAKHLWSSGQKNTAVEFLQYLTEDLDRAANVKFQSESGDNLSDQTLEKAFQPSGLSSGPDAARKSDSGPYMYGFGSILDHHALRSLRMKCHLRLGEWQWHRLESQIVLEPRSGLVHSSPRNQSNQESAWADDSKSASPSVMDHKVSSGSPTFQQYKDISPSRSRRRSSRIRRVASEHEFTDVMRGVLVHFKAATEAGSRSYKAWHAWALSNFQAAQRLHAFIQQRQQQQQHESELDNSRIANGVASYAARRRATFEAQRKGETGKPETPSKRPSLGFGFNTVPSSASTSDTAVYAPSNEMIARNRMVAAHVVPAVRGFFKSISLGRGLLKAHVLQDLLRLLTLWFTFGGTKHPLVRAELETGLASGAVGVDTWLAVVPQLIARIAIPDTSIRRLLHALLIRVGVRHPQALVYALSVAAKSTTSARCKCAMELISALRQTHPVLIDQAQLVSEELIRVAILWHEEWYSALDEASKYYFGPSHDTRAMVNLLLPLHQKISRGGATAHELTFCQLFAKDLNPAHDHLRKFQRTGDEKEINSAWRIYYTVFNALSKQLPELKSLELQYVSPSLLAATDLQLAVPGTYAAGSPIVRIRGFSASVAIIQSKQRPRKVTLAGSDGRTYTFLLKGHEDLRQDERAMQLFGLVNTLLANNPETSKRDLAIRRYSVTPLSHNAGIVGWVPGCDTLHALIEEHRVARKIFLNLEHRLMLQMAPMYDQMTLLQKVEVLRQGLDHTSGQDLDRVMWLKSLSSEAWLVRRTNYTRSLAVMSVVGYILGLGDRHPSNLMLERSTGKITHIDFGDCFEVAMRRDKFPERIPFRLTRMLVNAMEVSGIEGNFRSTAEAVMCAMREHRDSVMAMLEAFVHDPLINWRLFLDEHNSLSNQDVDDGDPQRRASTRGVSQRQLADPDLRAAARIPEQVAAVASASIRAGRAAAAAAAAGGYDLGDDVTGGRSYIGSLRLQTHEALRNKTAGADGRQHGRNARNINTNTEEEAYTMEVGSLRTHRGDRERALQAGGADAEDAPVEALNERAVQVLTRIKAKLTGRDFEGDPVSPRRRVTVLGQVSREGAEQARKKDKDNGRGSGAQATGASCNTSQGGEDDNSHTDNIDESNDQRALDVPAQIQRLIAQATSHESLAQLYVGWCPFW